MSDPTPDQGEPGSEQEPGEAATADRAQNAEDTSAEDANVDDAAENEAASDESTVSDGSDDEIVDAEIVPTPDTPGTPHPAHPAPPASPIVVDYTSDGVPTLDYVRSKIEQRYGTSVGATELSQTDDQRRMAEHHAQQRANQASDRLAELRRQVDGSSRVIDVDQHTPAEDADVDQDARLIDPAPTTEATSDAEAPSDSPSDSTDS